MIWITGARGQLGPEVIRALARRGLSWVASGHEVDVADPQSVAAFAGTHRPRWIVNLAAYTDVDRAETDREACWRTNAEGPGVLARWAHDNGAAMIHLSTDYVFDGEKGRPLPEDDHVNPVSEYGRSKAAGEAAVRAVGPAYILRTAWLYGADGHSFVDRLLDKFRRGDDVDVVDDQWGSPTWAGDVAEVIARIAEGASLNPGTYHVANVGSCSRYVWAQAVLSTAQRGGLVSGAPRVRAVSTAQYPTPARRPRWSVLDDTKLEAAGFVLPSWSQRLTEYLEREYRRHRPRSLLVTGGSGFIGSHFIRYLFEVVGFSGQIVNVDRLTYASHSEPPEAASRWQGRYVFVQNDIQDTGKLEALLREYRIDTVVHFAAESHVDRSIEGPRHFVETNIVGTFSLLQATRTVWGDRDDVRFHHVSTDEVYGSLGLEGAFTEESPYRPRSPYSATKAASDHLVRAWHVTYGLPVTLSHCSNNFGPGQHHEKLIPRMLTLLEEGGPLPLYGAGNQVRDWLYVEDHVAALWAIITRGRNGETYDIGGAQEWSNRELVFELCRRVADTTGQDADELKARVVSVPDRPGHDFRYAIDDRKIRDELGWRPQVSWQEALEKTIRAFTKPR